MFPLKTRKIGGYTFGASTWYSSKHLGTDYAAAYVPLYAPSNGRVERHDGTQGGITLWFFPNGNLPVMRFMHLSQVIKTGNVTEGEQIAVTGNTGSATTGPHLHIDISKTSSGSFWSDFNNFQDPEKYNWGGTMSYQVWENGVDIRFNDEQTKELMVNLSRKTPVNYHLRGWEVMQEIYTDNRAIIDGLNAQIASKDAVIAARDMSIKDLTEKYRKLDVDFDTYREDSADEIERLTKELKETKEKAVADLLVKQKKIDELKQIIKDKDLSKLSFWEKIILIFGR